MKYRAQMVGIVVIASLFAGNAFANSMDRRSQKRQPTPPPPAPVEIAEPVPLSFDVSQSKPVGFDRLVWNIRHGQKIGTYSSGLLCVGSYDLVWKGSRADIDPDDFQRIFLDEASAIGLRTAGDPDALFGDTSASKAEILVSGNMKKVFVSQCETAKGSIFASVRAKASVTINWQVYSTLDRKVVYKTSTTGTAENKTDPSGSEDFYTAILDAFVIATRRLVAEPNFHRIIAKSGEMLAADARGVRHETLQLDRGTAQTVRSVGDFSKAVGTVYATGGGHGSGFFITSDGHMLTNHHVVSSAQYVKVRMKSGDEYLAEVLRVDRRRDVALLKVSAKPEWIVELDRLEPEVGEEVYAVGSPIEAALSATVTRGIVSAKRVMDGQRFIQADAAISGGNSGGPLFGSKGTVVGMSTSGMKDGETLNFFGPVNDLLNALAVDVR